MFDSPFAFCPKCDQMVLLDQTQNECKGEHACGESACPLLACFSGYDFTQPGAGKKKGEEQNDRH